MTSLENLAASIADDEKDKEHSKSNRGDIPASTMDATSTTSLGHIDRILQNFRLVWLDSSIDEINNDDCIATITRLRQVVNAVKTFTNIDECTNFLATIENEKIFLIISGSLGETMVRLVHDREQITSFYIFCNHKEHHEQWAKEWPKVKGIHTDITSLCTSLKQAAQACDQNLISISFIKSTTETSNRNLDQLDQSFMYTQLLKETLLTMNFDDQHIDRFVTYCQEQFTGNTAELINVDKLQREYRDHQPIWWYTCNCFLYSMLNRALRLMEVDRLIKMGFFLQDLHKHISTLHTEQYDPNHHFDSFIVYRGQGLSTKDFDQLQNTQGGLLSFNNFLSTSQDQHVSLTFARQTVATSDLMGVLFVLKINPSIPSTPFANVRSVSYYKKEEEILFSMHSTFRIGQVTKIDNDDRLWQVDLTLTSDNDPQLNALTDSMREKTKGMTEWLRLSDLMIKVAQYSKAKELLEILLAQTTDDRERGDIYYQLGGIESRQANYTKAITFYETSLDIRQNILTSQHPDVADCYEDIANANSALGDFPTALTGYKKALDIREQTLSPNHPDLANSYACHGSVYDKMGDYSKALSYYEKALEIYQTILPPNHPDLATSYAWHGSTYYKMGDYSKALSYYEKALEIYQTILPPNHPDLATSYNNTGGMYDTMGEYSKALSYYEKALEIRQTTLPANHPDLAASYARQGSAYDNMGDYSKALSYYEKALEIQRTTLAANHPDLATSYNNTGGMYDAMGEYSKALSYYEKALEIYQAILPPNHPNLAISYNNTGGMYDTMGEYSKALSYYEKALEIRQATLPENHPDLAATYPWHGSAYDKMCEYSKALSHYEKALKIYQTILPPNHPDLATSYNNIGLVNHKMGEHRKARSNYEKALEIRLTSLPEGCSLLSESYNDIGFVCCKMGDYSQALSYHEEALKIDESILPPNHPQLAASYNIIGFVCEKMGEPSKGLLYYEKALKTYRTSLPPNRSHLASFSQ